LPSLSPLRTRVKVTHLPDLALDSHTSSGQVQLMTTEPLVKRLAALDTCAVSDALDHLQITGATTGVRPMWSCPKIAGYARTVEAVDAAAGPAGRHLGTSTVQAAGPGDVVVVASRGRTNVSCWGDILTAAAQARGIEGAVIDGACRDLDAVADAGFPVYARAAVPVTARGRLAERGSDVPVLFDGVLVRKGDLVLADGSGVVFLPAARAEQIIEAAERLTRRQEAMVAAIRVGEPVTEVMHDDRFLAALAGTDNDDDEG
jgi:4-hydroxy-4-methyl-2-oxoglutarate aldolase